MELPKPRKSSRPKKPKTFFDEETEPEKFLCLVCSVDVDTPPSGPSIKCNSCHKWVHYFCVPMSSETHKKWEEEKEAKFLCRKCCFVTDTVYNYYTALQRIRSAYPWDKKVTQAYTESLLLETFDIRLPDQGIPSGNIDEVSRKLLQIMHPAILENYVPLETGADGNCLYRAVSRGLYGYEGFQQSLRLRTTIELLLYQKIYDENSWYYCDFIQDNRVVTSPYTELVTSAYTEGAYSELAHMYAVSAVLQEPLRSYYPPTMANNLLTEPYSRKIVGRNVNSSRSAVVNIMWTQCIAPRKSTQFMPNHFVPLKELNNVEDLNVSSSQSSVVDISTDVDSQGKNTMFEISVSNSEDAEQSVVNDVSGCQEHELVGKENEFEDLNAFSFTKSSTPKVCSFNSDIVIDSEPNSLEKMSHISATNSDRVPYEGPYRGRLNKGKFLEMEQVLELLQDGGGCLNQLPPGIKEDVYFIVDNTANNDRKEKGKKRDFWDDCGAWVKGTSPSSVFLPQGNKLVNLVKRQGKYCTQKQENKIRTYQILEPQPSEGELLILHRVYSKNKLSLEYRRRVTWIGNVPEPVPIKRQPIALIEYLGIFPGRRPHGNNKKIVGRKNYIRVTDSTKETIKQQISKQNPKNAYDTLNTNDTENTHDLPRNVKQMHNFKYSTKVQERKNANSNTGFRKNLADHVLNVENMVYNHPFVKVVTHLTSGPSVILYTQEQIMDLKRFCCVEGGTILGVDKTFNLCDMFLTATVFKNVALVRDSTDKPPIFIGPCFLHGKSDFETFHHFFSHLSSLFTEEEMENMVIGTDDEMALRNAIRRAFPKAMQVLCTRHLKQNVLRYLEDKVGVPVQDRRQILSAIFGEDGITHADDSVIVEDRVQKAKDLITQKATTFQTYFERRILPLLENYVLYPARVKDIDADWTNNNAESVNYLFKVANDWKPKNLSDLVENIYTLVSSLYKDSERALIGSGNFRLAPAYQHNMISVDAWCQKDKNTRQLIFQKFLKDKGKKSGGTISSTNGKITIPATPNAGKKPSQVRRKLSERCRSRKRACKRIK